MAISRGHINYDERPANNIFMKKNNRHIRCAVCPHAINIQNQARKACVKCHNCKEHTPLKKANYGFRYVRCSCGMLFNCVIGQTGFHCHRCERKIMETMPENPEEVYECADCHEDIVRPMGTKFASCNSCNTRTSLGDNSAFWPALTFLLLAICIFGGTVFGAVKTFKSARGHPFIYGVWACGGILSFGLFVIAVYFFRMKVSRPIRQIQ